MNEEVFAHIRLFGVYCVSMMETRRDVIDSVDYDNAAAPNPILTYLLGLDHLDSAFHNRRN